MNSDRIIIKTCDIQDKNGLNSIPSKFHSILKLGINRYDGWNSFAELIRNHTGSLSELKVEINKLLSKREIYISELCDIINKK